MLLHSREETVVNVSLIRGWNLKLDVDVHRHPVWSRSDHLAFHNSRATFTFFLHLQHWLFNVDSYFWHVSGRIEVTHVGHRLEGAHHQRHGVLRDRCMAAKEISERLVVFAIGIRIRVEESFVSRLECASEHLR